MEFQSLARPARKIVLLISMGVMAGTVAAQNVLMTEYHDQWLPVVQARVDHPYVRVNGKLEAADGHRYALRKVEEYLPLFISIRNIRASTEAIDAGDRYINNEFKFNARLESAFALTDVFIVLELNTAADGKFFLLQEVGDLTPREPRSVDVRLRMTSALGEGHYLVHLFSRGTEVLHSELGAEHCDQVIDDITARRIALVRDAAPRLFVGPEPEYPAALFKKKTPGRVMMSVRIGANGRVYDPIVKTTSDPAFAEAALQAVRLWRFLPQVKEGVPVEIRASVPVDFTPTEALKK